MFTAIVIVCGSYACVQLTYDKALLATEAECMTKHETMVPLAMEFLARKGVPAPYIIKAAKCVKSESA